MPEVTFTALDGIVVVALGVAISVFLFIAVRRRLSAIKRSSIVGLMFIAAFLIGPYLKFSGLSLFFIIFAVFTGLLMTGLTYLVCISTDRIISRRSRR